MKKALSLIFVLLILTAANAGNPPPLSVDRLPADSPSPRPPTFDRTYCALQEHTGTPQNYFTAWMMGFANVTYFNPDNCGFDPTYPFEITALGVTFFNYTGCQWPFTFDIVVYDLSTDSCGGPGQELCRQTVTATYPEFAYPNVTTVGMTAPCCVNRPFYVGVQYTDPGNGPFPSILFDNDPTPDTCVNWFLYTGTWYEWYALWGPTPPGNPLFWLAGETNSPNCPQPSRWYWKPDTTYAWTGMPDFPSQQPCHSGPTAVTNCLWWYGAMDYYQFVNAKELELELFSYFQSDTIFDPWGGTDVHVMENGLLQFFTDVDPPWPFVETTYQAPDFFLMAESLIACQDIILLIGNWWQDMTGGWHRDGGRYVTMAGVNMTDMMVALSDPETDMAEMSFPGRVRPPHANHPPIDPTHWYPMTTGGYDYPVSHDAYPVMLTSPSPGGTWWLPGFPRGFSPTYANCPAEFVPVTAPNPDPTQFPYHAEVEYAVMICPGTPVPPIDTCGYYKQPYIDYAVAGMPDFDQKQNGWMNPANQAWSWCGPTALADCIWWFDSKFEPNPIDPRPFGIVPPNDGYPLVSAYGPWDDHDPMNLIPFISQLGPMCGVDGPTPGTLFPNLAVGFNNWLNFVGLGGRYTVYPAYGPQYPELRDSVLASQDVILLLGFYELLEVFPGCQRLGGHYVTAAGVCLDEPGICVSDPYFDKNEGNPPGPPDHAPGVHNDAQWVSGPHGSIHHDLYHLAPFPGGCPSPATWMLTDYPNQWTAWIQNFENQNPLDPGMPPAVYTGGQIIVLIDAALIICPAPLIPDIDIVPPQLDYVQCVHQGFVNYPDQFTISNTGTAPLTVSSITCDLAWITFPDFTPPALVLNPGDIFMADVGINTTGIPLGLYTGMCHVSSDDPDEPVVDLPVINVQVIGPDIDVFPDLVTGTQQVNTTVTYTNAFTVANTGSCFLNFSIGPTPGWISYNPSNGIVPQGGNMPVSVTVIAGPTPGVLVYTTSISSDDPDEPVVNEPVIQITVVEPESLYWKDFNGDLPEGYMSDFDQNQDINGNQIPDDFAYCGPTSVANSLWWFQGKYPNRTIVPPPFYMPPFNPVGFIQMLAGFMGTNMEGPTSGTSVEGMEAGLDAYLIQMGVSDLLYEHTLYMPTFDTIEVEIERCQDVTLLIGLWTVSAVYPQEPNFFVDWTRIGGHYVTAHGVNSDLHLIGFSDPDADNFEDGLTSGFLRGANHNHGDVPFRNPAYDHSQHNDGVSASHDIYPVTVLDGPLCSPAGVWELDHPYWRDVANAMHYEGQNGGMFTVVMMPWTCPYWELPPPEPWTVVFAEIEAAIIVSPVPEAPGFNYLPGDANMWAGIWPPQVLGADITFLVNYLRNMPTSVPCLMHNPNAQIAPPYFWASGDANGDCAVMGSDVIYLVNYLRGLVTPLWCSDFPPNYPPIPPVQPPGWPNCQIPITYEEKVVIPTMPKR